MADRYEGNMLIGLMNEVGKALKLKPGDEVPDLKVKVGGKIVTVDGVTNYLPPEVIEFLRRIEAEKQAAIASGKPFTKGQWLTKDPAAKAELIAIAREAGFPDLFD